jgi:RNA polymerase sigma factor (TIGR02999 family)
LRSLSSQDSLNSLRDKIYEKLAVEMKNFSEKNLTEFLQAWNDGDSVALDQLTEIVYQELHRIAHNYMRKENLGHALQTTALVNEAYLRLADQKNTRWQNRSHFFAIASSMMRRILVDYARSNLYQKRGGGAYHISLSHAEFISQDESLDIIALDEALQNLAKIDKRRGRVVELRFFGGLSVQETSDVLGISVDTVMRDWNLAKAWLKRELT